MTARLTIPAEEHRTVRLFAVNLPEAQVTAMLRDTPPAPPGELPQVPAAATLLDWPALDTRHTELFAIRDLTGLGLTGYLTEGLGLDEAEIAADRPRLAALEGYVLIVLSHAFARAKIDAGKPGQIVLVGSLAGMAATAGSRMYNATKFGLRGFALIGTYREKSAPVLFEPLPGTAGQGTLTGKPAPADKVARARLLRLAALSALILMLLAIALVAVLGAGE